LGQFKENHFSVLIATDIAARGLHIADVSHIFNFDLSQDPEEYVHRIGRTARLGASGVAISFACEEYVYHLPEIEDYIGEKLRVCAITNEMTPELKHPPRKRPQKRSGASRNGPPKRHRQSGSRHQSSSSRH